MTRHEILEKVREAYDDLPCSVDEAGLALEEVIVALEDELSTPESLLDAMTRTPEYKAGPRVQGRVETLRLRAPGRREGGVMS